MAKRNRAASMASASRGASRKSGGGRSSTSASADRAMGGSSERMRGAGGRDEREGEPASEGMLAGARRFGARTGSQAKRWASGAKDAATSVASRTKEGASQAVDKVKEHPWPALLIGAGMTWLAVDAVRGRSSGQGRRRSLRRSSKDSGPGIWGRTASTIAGAGRGAGEYVGDFVRERPLLAGATTLGIGMAVGMAMPSTSAENSLMGGMRDTVVRRAKDAARSTMAGVREVADSVERIAGRSGR